MAIDRLIPDLLLLLTMTLAAPAYGVEARAFTAPEPALLRAAERAMVRLNAEAERLKSVSDADWEQHCGGFDHLCRSYLREHPEALAGQMIRSPAYWSAFFAVLALPSATPVWMPDEEPVDVNGSDALFEAARRYPLFFLSGQESGQPLSYAEAIELVRRRHALSHTLIDRVMNNATFLMLLNGTSYHLMQLQRRGDGTAIERLRRALRPLTLEERSHLGPFKGERAYALQYFAAMPTTGSAQYLFQQRVAESLRGRADERHVQTPVMQTDAEVAANLAMWQQQLDRQPALFGDLVALSELPRAEFWRADSQVHKLRRHVSTHESLEFSPATNYLRFLQLDAALDVMLHLTRALLTFHAGTASPGIPAVPAPTHFQWLWRAEDQTLCAEPISVSANIWPEPEPICLAYWPAS